MTPDLIFDQLIGAGCAPAADLLVGRQPGRRLAAPLPRRRRARVAAPAGARGAQPRGHGQPLRGRRVRAPVRGHARLRRHRPARAHADDQADRVPVHGRGADRRLGAAAGRRRSCTRSAPTATATCSCGASPACRRRRCWPPRARWSPSRRSSTSSTRGRTPSCSRAGRWTCVSEAPGGARPSYALGYYDRDNDAYRAWDDDRPRPRAVRRGGWRRCERDFTRDDQMTVAASRALRDGAVCFVGIGLPSTAANLARRTHAPGLVLVYESGTIGAKPTRLPLSIGDGELATTADAVVGVPGDLQLLAAARPHRRRLPRRGADRPLREHQHDGHRRRATTSPRSGCRAPAARPRSRRRAAR